MSYSSKFKAQLFYTKLPYITIELVVSSTNLDGLCVKNILLHRISKLNLSCIDLRLQNKQWNKQRIEGINKRMNNLQKQQFVYQAVHFISSLFIMLFISSTILSLNSSLN